MTQGIIGACGEAVADLLRGFDERESAILRGRIVNLAGKRTLQQIATEFSITRERVRQIEEAIVLRIQKRVRSFSGELLRRASRYLKGAMGAACPLGSIAPERIYRKGSGEDEMSEDMTLGMLIWLAGPYEVYRGWLVRAPAETVVGLTKRAFRRVIARQEPCDIPSVVEAFAELNVHERWALDWLSVVDRVKILDGKICSWSGGLSRKAYLVLAVHGSEMTADDICREIGDTCQRRSLLNSLHSRPDRFRKSGPGLFSLTEWGGEEHTSVKEFVLQQVTKLGGRARKESLVEETMSRLAVPKRTVTAVLGNPIFVHTGAGYVRIRSKEDPMPRIHPVEFTKHCYRLSLEHSGRKSVRVWSYRITVDSETLRGSGGMIPAAFASLLGLRPGERRTASSLFGDVQFSWQGPQGNIGSVRAAASGLDARLGDFLFVSLAGRSTVTFTLVRAQELEAVSGWERICLEVSGTKGDSKEARITEVGLAIGLSERADFTIGDIRRRLEMRRERDLLEWIPEADLSEESEDLSELLEYALER